MKQIILQLSTVVLLLLFIVTGCQKDEIPNPVIQPEFKLLNEKGTESTTFKEGENFVFQFEINTNDTTWRFNKFVKMDSNFFRVYRIENGKQIDIGTPFKSYWCNTIEYVCGHNTPFLFELPWVTGTGENEIPDQTTFPPFCMFYETTFLPKGNYITYFDDMIEFVRCDKLTDTNHEQFFYTTELLHFEIEFEIN